VPQLDISILCFVANGSNESSRTSPKARRDSASFGTSDVLERSNVDADHMDNRCASGSIVALHSLLFGSIAHADSNWAYEWNLIIMK